MNWLRKKVIRWLGVPTLAEFYAANDKGLNLGIRINAAEGSCRLVEKRLKEIESVTLNFERSQSSGPFHTLGEVASLGAEGNKQATELRYDKSAAEARGMSLEEYRAFKEATRGDKLQ